MATTLVNYVHFHGVEPSNDVIEFELIVGEGDSRIVNGHTIHIGDVSKAWMGHM
jgi:hypothetical protein